MNEISSTDTTAIKDWLAREFAARSDFVVPQTEDLGIQKWQLHGILQAENWAVEVEYRKSEPGVATVRLTATEPGHVQDEIVKFDSVFLDHGLLPFNSQQRGFGLTSQSALGILGRPDAFLARVATMTPEQVVALPAPSGETQSTQWERSRCSPRTPYQRGCSVACSID